MNPTDILRAEHETIERMLDATQSLARAIGRGHPVSPAHLAGVAEFFREFADGFHHRKEEELLFPALEEAGVPRDGGPIGVMLADHRRGRELVRAMSEAASRAAAGDGAALGEFAEAAEDFEMLLRSHIQRENGVLFRIAERVLDPAVQRRLAEEFESLAAERPVAELSRRYEALAREIAESCPTCGPGRPPG